MLSIEQQAPLPTTNKQDQQLVFLAKTLTSLLITSVLWSRWRVNWFFMKKTCNEA